MKHIDPVCGMIVNEENAREKYDYKGIIYYFCCSECLEVFKNNPEKYIDSETKENM